MKASINDINVLLGIKAIEATSYLRNAGWKSVLIKDRFSLWQNTKEGEEFEILLPLDLSLKDYGSRMGQLLDTLMIFEGRPKLQVFHDIQSTSADLIRIRAEHDSFVDGTVRLNSGVALVTHARDLILAAACSAVERKQFYHSRKPAGATEYLDKVRLGQTEHGSYIVTIHSPVQPVLRTDPLLFPMEEKMPFERVVTTTLMKAISATKSAAEKSATTGDLKPFLDAVPEGLSANFCDAIVGLYEETDASRIHVGISWSPNRHLSDQSIKNIVVLSSDTVPIIKEASQLLWESTPKDDFELKGFVVVLKRATLSAPGQITLNTFIDDAPRKVQIGLSKEDYQKAIDAHEGNQIVRCVGELKKSGRVYALENPRGFTVFEENSH